MSISVLPNMRWFSLSSEFSGEDWREQSLKIDEAINETGHDLAEEAVYLLYDLNPSSVLAGEARCKIARSVIGPKKTPDRPFELIDWKAAPVEMVSLKSQTWDELFEEASKEWVRAGSKHKVFILCMRRRLVPQLQLETIAIFGE